LYLLPKANDLSNNSKDDSLTTIILKVINEKKPRSVKHLINILQENSDFQEEDLLFQIIKLKDDGIVQLETDTSASVFNLASSLWYLLTIAFGAIAVLLVITISQNSYPWIYARIVFGLIFIFFLPGYALLRALFPVTVQDASLRSIETIEKTAMSIALSIALVSIVGLALYYSPFQLSLNAVVVSVFVLASFFATAGLLRKNKLSEEQRPLNNLIIAKKN
jgi:uncharacterized membrane protein